MPLSPSTFTRFMQRRHVLKTTAGMAGAFTLGSFIPSQNVSAAASSATGSSHENQRNADLVRQFYIPFNTGETSIYKKILAPNWIDNPLNPGQGPGPDGLAAVVQNFRTTFDNLHIENQDIIVACDKVTVRSVMSGVQKGTFLGIAPTGLPVSFRTVDIHRIQNNLIVETWHLEDIFTAIVQLKAFSPS